MNYSDLLVFYRNNEIPQNTLIYICIHFSTYLSIYPFIICQSIFISVCIFVDMYVCVVVDKQIKMESRKRRRKMRGTVEEERGINKKEKQK